MNAPNDLEASLREICGAHDFDQSRLLDIARDVQARLGGVSGEAIGLLASLLKVPRVQVEGVVSFYAFLSREPEGEVVLRLCDDVVDRMCGYDEVRAALEAELGIRVGETTSDGRFTLQRTACIGMSDQAPAVLVGDVVVTSLDPERARTLVRELREHGDPSRLVLQPGDGNNAHPLVQAMVRNNIREVGPVLSTPLQRLQAVRKALSMSPAEVIRAMKTARLRGRGGAGFPTGMKWEFTRAAPGEQRVVICNADEGEPGTFKDRVLLTELPDRVFAGMTVAGYAIGASEGILYLRAEYAYLRAYLEDVLERRRADGLLGRSILGHSGVDFDIRIQLGAGAYVCGEETALISSCEGVRGDPKTRPPFPAQKGYLGRPTVVNNVETLCCVAKVLEDGPASFSVRGHGNSTGSKLLSVSGDCDLPGIYEVAFGTSVREVLEKAGAEDAAAVQIGGPAGQLVGPDDFDRRISYEDLPTGGAFLVLGPGRDIIEIAHWFLEFFEDESCGYCTPCRIGNVLLREGLERILEGRGEHADLEHFEQIGATMRATSRCGLGQTSANPVMTSLAAFRHRYEARVADDPRGRRRAFDLAAAVSEAERIAGRRTEARP